MNEEIAAKMRKELAGANGFGISVFMVCFIVLVLIAKNLPGVDELMNAHRWPAAAMLLISIMAGWIGNSLRADSNRQKANSYDEDTLKFKYDEFKRKKLKSDLMFFVVIVLIFAYFVFNK